MKFKIILCILSFLFLNCGYKAPPPGKPDWKPPVIQIVYPQVGDTIYTDTVVNFMISDESPIKVVRLIVDGKVVSVDSIAPFELRLLREFLKDSSRVKVAAIDNWDNIGESKSVTVFIPSPEEEHDKEGED